MYVQLYFQFEQQVKDRLLDAFYLEKIYSTYLQKFNFSFVKYTYISETSFTLTFQTMSVITEDSTKNLLNYFPFGISIKKYGWKIDLQPWNFINEYKTLDWKYSHGKCVVN